MQTNISLSKILLLVLVAAGIFFAYQLVEYRNSADDRFKAQLQKVSIDAANNIDEIALQVASQAKLLAQDMSQPQTKIDKITRQLQDMVSSNGLVFGGSITFKPYAFASDRKLYSLYFSKSAIDQKIEFQQLDEIYDYTQPSSDWYTDAIEQGDRWSKPYWDEAGKTYMITYSALFYADTGSHDIGQAIGLVTLDISMARIRNIIESLNLDASGFGALTTNDGDYLYHPNYQYVRERLNLLDVAEETGDVTRVDIAPLIKLGKSGVADHVSTTTGEEAWLFYQALPNAGWSLQNTFFKSSTQVSQRHIRQQYILIIMLGLLSLILLLYLVLPKRLLGFKPYSLWAALSSVLLVSAIWSVWWLALEYHEHQYNKNLIRIADNGYLTSLVSAFKTENTRKNIRNPIFISTGLEIETMDFPGPNDIAITGKVWQIYPDSYPQDWGKGFEIGQAKKFSSELIEQRKIAGGEIFSWRFQALIRANLNHSRYPLEVENIDIAILPVNQGNEVAFVPDLKAYKFISPGLLPGLAEDVFIPGWNITESYFSFIDHEPTILVGKDNNFDQENFYQLHFNIGISRLFIDAFISNLTPLIVVVIILYSVLLLPTSIDISRTLGICVSVFFVVIYSHLSIRRAISIDTIFYLEYFYLVIYLMVIIAPMNSFRTTLGITNQWLDYEQGRLPKLLFWPVILSVFLLITVIKFY